MMRSEPCAILRILGRPSLVDAQPGQPNVWMQRWTDGPAGNLGPKGDAGTAGLLGTTGPAGLTGPAGPAGPVTLVSQLTASDGTAALEAGTANSLYTP
jgi:hypothetical protein